MTSMGPELAVAPMISTAVSWCRLSEFRNIVVAVKANRIAAITPRTIGHLDGRRKGIILAIRPQHNSRELSLWMLQTAAAPPRAPHHREFWLARRAGFQGDAV